MIEPDKKRPPVEPFTISDHVRNMHDAGVSIKMICQVLDLRHQTVESWISQVKD